MTNNFFLKLSKFFLYLVPFTVIIVSQSTLFPFIVGKYVFFRVAVELALISYLFSWAFQFKEVRPPKINSQSSGGRTSKILKSPLVIAISVFVLIFLLAGFFGYNPSASFWSNFERGEGGLQMLHLFVFFILLVLLLKDEKAWRKMFVVSLWAAGLVIAYGLTAALGISNFVGSNLCARFAGSLGNPAYVGTYMIFAIFYISYLFTSPRQSASSPRKSASLKKWFWIGLLVVFFVFLIFSQTRGALFGLGVGVLAGLSYLFFRLPHGRGRKIVLVIIIILIILGGLGFKFRRSIDLMPFCKGQGGNRILDINLKTETFQTRLLLWKQSIKIFKERPILGWGPENFSPAFEKHYDYRFEVWYDRAHNIFFDYLVMTGALGLLSFLGIFATFYWQFLRKTRMDTDKNTDKHGLEHRNIRVNPFSHLSRSVLSEALIFALPIAYLIQGLVLFDVLPIYINLFLFLAFANYKFSKPF